MNPQHLSAFFWLQWRLRINQLKRGGVANIVIMTILAAGALLLAALMFVGFLLVGVFLLGEASPLVVMLVWDGVVGGFLFFWLIGLLADLQRSESLSLTKFLHLPVSLSGVFVLNYVTSLLSLNLILFAPAMVGLALGLLFSRGPAILVIFPLVAALLLAVTALTYQFQGWLASLMANKRRRRTVVLVVTMILILIVQLPNLINFLEPWKMNRSVDAEQQFSKEIEALDRARVAKEIDEQQYGERKAELEQQRLAQRADRGRQTWETVEQTARIVNLCFPPGWLPFSAAAAAEGSVVPALLGTLGLGLIGTASLWRSYRTTVRLYVGAYTAGQVQPPPKTPKVAATGGVSAPKASAGILAKELPWLSEQAAAIALAGFRSLTRAPEVKMLLLMPVLTVVIFGGIVLKHSVEPPALVRPLLAFGGIAMMLLTLIQLAGNQFGFDRGGFRVFVLCAARRRDILLGKNLALAPLALAFAAVAVAFVQIAYPMRLDHLLAMFPQAVSMYLIYCLIANCLSILTPLPIAAGSLKPTNAKLAPVLLQFVFLLTFPIVIAPTQLPLALEALFEYLDWVHGLPVFLILALLECAGLVLVFRWLVGWQGVWLQAREQRIMEIVTTKAE